MATLVVTTLTDRVVIGATTQRDAISRANATDGVHRIEFADGVEGTIRLYSGQLNVTDELTIAAGGDITINGDRLGNDFKKDNGVTIVKDYEFLLGDNTRIFNITSDANAVTLKGLTLSGGRTTGSSALARGGAIYAGDGVTLNIVDSTLAGNSTSGVRAYGGAVSSRGAVNVTGSTSYGNQTSAKAPMAARSSRLTRARSPSPTARSSAPTAHSGISAASAAETSRSAITGSRATVRPGTKPRAATCMSTAMR